MRGGRLSATGAQGPRVAANWRETMHARLLVCAAGLALWTVGIEARLVYLQVIDHADLLSRADRQQTRTVFPSAKRGEIVDRNGRLLAYSVDADTIAAVPTEIDDPAGRGRRHLSVRSTSCTADTPAAIVKSLSRKSSFAYVARQVSPEEAKRVKALALPGITMFKESRRYYPNSELAAHVIGYVGLDNKGLGGIESAYDSQIRGHDGKVLIQTDNKRHALFSRVELPSTAGAGIELTIDEYLQHVAERELRTGVEENHAQGGTAIVMDPAYRRDPGACQLADVQPEHVLARRRRCEAESRDPDALRARIDVQDRDGLGRARAESHHARDDRRDQSRVDHVPRPQADFRHAQVRNHSVHRRDREVEQRRRDQGRSESRSGRAHAVRQPVRVRPDARRRTSRARRPASSGARSAWTRARSHRSRWGIRSA